MTPLQQQIVNVLENDNVVALITTPVISITCNDLMYFLSGKAGYMYKVPTFNFKTIIYNELTQVYFRKDLKFIIRRVY